jgi:hypothetical protein
VNIEVSFHLGGTSSLAGETSYKQLISQDLRSVSLLKRSPVYGGEVSMTKAEREGKRWRKKDRNKRKNIERKVIKQEGEK